MKKQFLILGIICLLSVVFVSALLIEHYEVFQTDINVIQPISVEGNLIQYISGMSGEVILGDEIIISNIANWDISVYVVSDNNESEISVIYMGADIDSSSNNVIVTIPKNGNIKFNSIYELNSKLASGIFTITTEVNPLA